MNTLKWFIKAVSHLSLIFSTHWCHRTHLMSFCYMYCWCHCTTSRYTYLFKMKMCIYDPSVYWEWENKSLKWYLIKKGVIHMVNMSFFLSTCSVVKEEREREKYWLHNSIWSGLIVNCAQEKKKERIIPFYFPSLFQ